MGDVTSVARPPAKYMIGRSISANPTLATLYGAMNGMTGKPANISTMVNENVRRWFGSPKIARSCATGRRRTACTRWPEMGGRILDAAMATITLAAEGRRKGGG